MAGTGRWICAAFGCMVERPLHGALMQKIISPLDAKALSGRGCRHRKRYEPLLGYSHAYGQSLNGEQSLFKQEIIICFGLGWRGAVQILSTVTTFDWDLLESGESNKGENPFTADCLQTHLASGRKST